MKKLPLAFVPFIALGASLFIATQSDDRLYVWNSSAPKWLIVSIVLILGLAYALWMSIQLRYPVRLAWALLVFPALTAAVGDIVLTQSAIRPPSVWLVLFWAVASAAIVHSVWPQALRGRRFSRTIILLLVLTAVYALTVRVRSEIIMQPIVVLVGALTWAIVFRYGYTRIADSHDHVADESTANKLRETTLRRTSVLWLVLTGVFIVWGGWLRIAGIDSIAFANDEYYHVNAGMGYVQTGEFVEWNFLTNQPEKPYTRAWMYTWQVAQSIQLFGISEWSVRLPALLWGLALLVLLPLAVWRWSRSPELVALVAGIAAFDDGLVWSSTYSRMYSMFFVVVLLALWCFQRAMNTSASFIQRCIWLIGSFVLALVGAQVHQVGYIVVLGMGAAVLLLWIQQPVVTWYRGLSIALLIAGCTGLIIHFFVFAFLPPSFLIIKAAPAYEYLQYLIQNYAVWWLAGVFMLSVLAVVPYKRLPSWLLTIIGFVGPIVLYFIFLAPRYAARKYALFAIVFSFVVVAWAWKTLFHSVPLRYRNTLSTVLFLWVMLPFAIPGLPTSAFLFEARADKNYDQLEEHNFPAAYGTVESYAFPNETVLMLYPRTYYLHRADIQYVQMPTYSVFTIADVQRLVAEHESGWIVWPKYKGFHVRQDVKDYIASNFDRVPKTKKTNVMMFTWGHEWSVEE